MTNFHEGGGVSIGKSGKSPSVATSVSKLFNKTMSDLKNSSNEKQLAVGAIAGLTTGYISSKFGKIVLTAIGGSLLILQVSSIFCVPETPQSFFSLLWIT